MHYKGDRKRTEFRSKVKSVASSLRVFDQGVSINHFVSPVTISNKIKDGKYL